MKQDIPAKTVQSVAKATESDQNAPWHSFLHVWTRDALTTIEAATSDFAVAVEEATDQVGEIECVVHRIDIRRLNAGETLTLTEQDERVSISGPFVLGLDPADGTGLKLRDPYPDMGARWWDEAKRAHAAGKRGFCVHPKTLAKAVGIFNDLGCEWVDIRWPAGPGDVVRLYGERADGSRVMGVVNTTDAFASDDPGGLFGDPEAGDGRQQYHAGELLALLGEEGPPARTPLPDVLAQLRRVLDGMELSSD